jgi:hypothetical protein
MEMLHRNTSFLRPSSNREVASLVRKRITPTSAISDCHPFPPWAQRFVCTT